MYLLYVRRRRKKKISCICATTVALHVVCVNMLHVVADKRITDHARLAMGWDYNKWTYVKIILGRTTTHIFGGRKKKKKFLTGSEVLPMPNLIYAWKWLIESGVQNRCAIQFSLNLSNDCGKSADDKFSDGDNLKMVDFQKISDIDVNYFLSKIKKTWILRQRLRNIWKILFLGNEFLRKIDRKLLFRLRNNICKGFYWENLLNSNFTRKSNI